MEMLCKKLFCAVLILLLTFTLMSAALAEETILKATLTGMYPTEDGGEKAVPVSCVFDVYQANAYVGRLEVDPEVSNTIVLPGTGNARLVPVAGTYPAELPLNPYGCDVPVRPGQMNTVTLVVTAKVKPAPVSTPTPAPTQVPTTGSLLLHLTGDEVTVAYTVEDSLGAKAAEGTLQVGQQSAVSSLQQGEYVITLHLPENAAVVALNENKVVQRGDVLWRVPLEAMKTSRYLIEVTGTGDAAILLEDIDSAEMMLRHDAETIDRKVMEAGQFSITGLLPGSYDAEIILPAGRYACEDSGVKMTALEDGSIKAEMSFAVSKGNKTELPAISRKTTGAVSGIVYDVEDAALSGVTIDIVAENGDVTASTKTDKTGAWQVNEVQYGTYTVRYTLGKRTIPSALFTLSDDSTAVELRGKEMPSAEISVRAFLDRNNNGTSGKGEEFVRDVEIALISEDGAVAAAGKTGRDGYATLTVPEGKYYLEAVASEDYGFAKRGSDKKYTHSIMDETGARTQRSALLTLTAGKTLEVGIGLQQTAVVNGTIWNDVNADGIWQKEEPGVPGIRVTLTGTRNGDSHEVYTDENGWYEFRQVRIGSYRLNCHLTDEYVFTIKAKGELAEISRMTTEADRIGQDNFALDRGEVHDQHNIGLMKGLIIEGVCFLDANSNGVYDAGDQPLPGVEMNLARQSNNVLLQTVVSGEDGHYSFVGQRGSTFTVRANLPKGCVFSVLGEGNEGNRFAPNDGKRERKIYDITVENGGHAFISVGATQLGSISGRVYFDDNFSSVWERGERAGADYVVTLCNAQGERINTAKTDKNGNYSFGNLYPGQYLLQVKPAAGYAFTALGEGNVMQTMPDGSGQSRLVTVGLGESVINAGAGMIVPAIVSGVFFADDNDNGFYDDSEPGLQGGVVRLMNEQGEVFSAEIDPTGAYAFNAVLPGRYYVQYELPANAVFASVVEDGSRIAGEGAGVSDWFSVTSGTSWQADLCGGVLLSDMSGFVFADSNGNAVMDEDETLLSGMRITLTPVRSDLEEITVNVGEDGRFSLTALRPGQYTLTVICPDSYVLSRLADVSMGLQHGLHEQTIQLDLKMGTQWHDQYLGCVLPASWTGEAYLDENYDGLRGADEAPAAGETLVLIDAETREVVSAVQTDAQGVFVIEGIAPGEYELTYPMDEGNLMPKDGDTDFAVNGSVLTNGRVRISENEAKADTVLAVVRTTEISGCVWLEAYDGVTPVQGAKLHLLDAQGNAIAEYTTTEDGKYAFKGLMPADYAVDVIIPQGYVLVESGDPRLLEAGLTSFVEEPDGLFGKSQVIHLKMAGHQTQMDAVVVLPGRLGDKVWLDLNGNGLQDGDEGGIPGVGVELLRGEKVVASTVSDQYGYYVFEELYPTEYTLRVTWPAEVAPTVRRTDIHQIVSVLQENGLTIPVEVESNKANYAADLGFILLENGKYPAGYGEGEKQIWVKK